MIVSQEKIKEFIKEQHAIDGMVSIHDFELWLEQQPKVGEWIPCSERLPNDERKVLVWYRSKYFDSDEEFIDYTLARRRKEHGDWSGAFFEDVLDVIAWMPLPEAYKEEGAGHEE